MNQVERGAVLLEEGGVNVIKVQSHHLDPISGGPVDLIYTTNGILKKTAVFHMDLVRIGNRWYFQTNDQTGRRPFTSMFLTAKKFLGKVIGIQKISVR
jgi:hypothetical protein